MQANLVIDQGNSSAKVALFEEGEMVWSRKYETFSVAEAKVLLAEWNVRQAILSTVRSEDADLSAFLRQSLSKWVVLDDKTPVPIGNLYKTPSTLGRDRLAVCVGANYLCPNRNLLVMDVGTAVTFDVVNAQNQYVGGNISLGIDMRRRALHTFTAKLPLVEVPDDVPLIGTTTDEAIAAGVINGLAGEMEAYIGELSAVYPDLAVFLTGGSSKCFEKRIKSKIFAYPNLVQIGLNRILDY